MMDNACLYQLIAFPLDFLTLKKSGSQNFQLDDEAKV